MKFHDTRGRRLIETHHGATAEYWDRKWRSEPLGTFKPEAVQPYIALTRQWLPPQARILEGGCGTGGKMAALLAAGFRVTGVDYAEATVARLQATLPALDVRLGDVFRLDLADASFDGYWSFGVIEHFWGGYQGLLSEAARVLRPSGMLFLTFPTLSPLRRTKAALGLYRGWPAPAGPHQAGPPPADMPQAAPADFYQFMLDPQVVCQHLRAAGFVPQPPALIQASHGLKNELPRLWRALLLAGRPLPAGVKTWLGAQLEQRLAARLGHLCLLAARKA